MAEVDTSVAEADAGVCRREAHLLLVVGVVGVDRLDEAVGEHLEGLLAPNVRYRV